MMEDDIRDKQIEEQTKPLAMRLFQSTQVAKEDGLTSVSKTEQLNAQLNKIVTTGEETKQSPERQLFDELQRVQRDLFEEDSLCRSEEENGLMDLNVPDSGEIVADLGAKEQVNEG